MTGRATQSGWSDLLSAEIGAGIRHRRRSENFGQVSRFQPPRSPSATAGKAAMMETDGRRPRLGPDRLHSDTARWRCAHGDAVVSRPHTHVVRGRRAECRHCRAVRPTSSATATRAGGHYTALPTSSSGAPHACGSSRPGARASASSSGSTSPVGDGASRSRTHPLREVGPCGASPPRRFCPRWPATSRPDTTSASCCPRRQRSLQTSLTGREPQTPSTSTARSSPRTSGRASNRSQGPGASLRRRPGPT